MAYSISTDQPDCDGGYAVTDIKGNTLSCHSEIRHALNHQRKLTADEVVKDDPTVNDVHQDAPMGRVRIKKPALTKDAKTLQAQHDFLHSLNETPSEAQLYVHHLILDELRNASDEVMCSLGKWSVPVVIDSVEADLRELQKAQNPDMTPIQSLIQEALDKDYSFADVLQMLDVGGFSVAIRPKEIDETPDTTKSVLSKIKDLLEEALSIEKSAPTSFVPPQAVREEAKRALAWIKDGKAGANFTSTGHTRATQLANGEAISRDTLARMKSFLARHEVDSQGKGYSPGEAGYPSPGRVAYAAWGGSAAKTWVDKLFRQYDLAKSYGETQTVFKADEQRFTLGPWYIPDKQDAHGEWTDSTELQTALWNYVKSGDRRIRLQHNKNVVAGEWVEAMTWPYPVTVPMTKADGTTEDVTYPTGTVFMGVQWEPWAWNLVKAGKLSGYSIGGKSERMLVDLPDNSGNENG
jgi:Putative phage serine protease XkdF